MEEATNITNKNEKQKVVLVEKTDDDFEVLKNAGLRVEHMRTHKNKLYDCYGEPLDFQYWEVAAALRKKDAKIEELSADLKRMGEKIQRQNAEIAKLKQKIDVLNKVHDTHIDEQLVLRKRIADLEAELKAKNELLIPIEFKDGSMLKMSKQVHNSMTKWKDNIRLEAKREVFEDIEKTIEHDALYGFNIIPEGKWLAIRLKHLGTKTVSK